MDDKQKSSIAARIEALLNKTTENGATEEEAMMAMAKAQELMIKYQLNLTEVQLAAEGLKTIKIDFGTNAQMTGFAFEISGAIASLTETACYQHRRKNGLGEFVVIGLHSDAQYAEYLLKSLANFAQNQIRVWWKTSEFYNPKAPVNVSYKLKVSFLHGVALRISRKIKELDINKVNRDTERVAGGLVPLSTAKKTMITDFMNSTGVAPEVRDDHRQFNRDALVKGWEAGANANLNRGIDKETTLRLK